MPVLTRRSFLALAALALVTWCGSGCRASDPTPTPADGRAPRPAEPPSTLILLSFDGWRWDYHTKAPTPNLHALMARGVRAERLIPVYPTKTFPNHYSIVTGLYPEHHGVVGNTMREPGTTLRFMLSDRRMVGDSRWWGGEPIWVTAKRQGLRTATLFWPGSEAAIGGLRPDRWLPYDGALPNEVRVDRILAWLDLPASARPALITGYFSDTDDSGHRAGPDSVDVWRAIVRLDGMVGRLLAGIAARQLTERINLVIVSDHGMAARMSDRKIALADYIDLRHIDIVEIDPHLTLNVRRGTVDEIHRRLARAHPHLHVYLKAQSPPHWRYRQHPRIPAIVGVVDEGWTLVSRRAPWPAIAGRVTGNHGYDPQAISMHGLFVAAGPAFKQGQVVAPFENVHIYDALASALGVQPAPNDGDPAIARQLTR